MNRSIQIGDFVTVSYPDHIDLHYTVNDIKNNTEIYIINLNNPSLEIKLSFSNNKWRLEDNDLDYKIRFSSKIIVTGIPEIDFKILLDLDIKTLKIVSKLSEYTKEICKNQTFWKLKIRKDYQDFPLSNLSDITYKYGDLYLMIKNIEKMLNLDKKMSIFLKSKINNEISNLILKDGYINILKWICNKFPLFYKKGNKSFIFRYGKLNLIEWFIREYKISDSEISSYAIRSKRIDIIDWMVLNKRSFLSKQYQIDNASKKDVLDLIKKIYEVTGMLPQSVAINIAIVNNNKEMFDWLSSKGLKCDDKIVVLAAKHNRLDIIKEYESKGFILTQELADVAVLPRNLEILKYMESKGFLPTEESVHEALTWFKIYREGINKRKTKIKIDDKERIIKILEEQKELKKWLVEKKIYS